MKMFKKDGDPKKPKAAAKKPVVKAKVVVKAKPMATPSPKKAYTPTAKQKIESADAGRRAANESRASGKRNGPIFNAIDRGRQRLLNETATSKTKRSKSGGAIDMADEGFKSRYSGMSNKQLGY